jgi:glycosyltransferase involved in cell wall biosynthesis
VRQKRIIFFPRYTRLGASSRLRTFQFQQHWENEGFQINIYPFFNDTYLKDFYGYKRLNLWNLIYCYIMRIFYLMKIPKYDIIWFEKELIPYFPPIVERLIIFFKINFIVDYDDAFFHNYENHKNFVVKTFLGKKIDSIMKCADLVFVGNAYLLERAKISQAKNIVLLPTVISSSKYNAIKSGNLSGKMVKIGWIGSPTTIKYLKGLLPVLEKINDKCPFELVVVNGERSVNFSGVLTHIKWKEEEEVNAILNMDIGIMPLPNEEWEKGKCAYKLIQYMACGLPVVASPVGMNTMLVQHGINGFLVENEEEWIESLTYLILNPYVRNKLGRNGHQLVHNNYTVEFNFQIMRREVKKLISSY